MTNVEPKEDINAEIKLFGFDLIDDMSSGTFSRNLFVQKASGRDKGTLYVMKARRKPWSTQEFNVGIP